MNREKYPTTYKESNIEKFKQEFKTWSSNYIINFFEELNKEYAKKSRNDKKREHQRLSSNLENLATSLYLTSRHIEKKEGTLPKIKPKDLAKEFVNTNYFYQEETFNALSQDLPRIFQTTLKTINEVCKSYKKKLNLKNI